MLGFDSSIDIQISKCKNTRIGILLQRKKGRIAIVARNDQIENLYVGDFITHVNGEKMKDPKKTARKIFSSHPNVTLTIQRHEFTIHLLS